MLEFLLAGGGEGVVEEIVPAVILVGTPTATLVYDGLIERTGFPWGMVALWVLGIVFVLLLAYTVYSVVKGAEAKK